MIDIAIRPEYLTQDERSELGLPSTRCNRCGMFPEQITKCLRCGRNGCGYCLYEVGEAQYHHNCCPLKRSSASWNNAQRRAFPIELKVATVGITREHVAYSIRHQKCRGCGVVFYLGDWRFRYCDECIEKRPRRVKPREPITRMCRQCGFNFETTNGQRWYCDNCPPVQSSGLRRSPSVVIRQEGTYAASPHYVQKAQGGS